MIKIGNCSDLLSIVVMACHVTHFLFGPDYKYISYNSPFTIRNAIRNPLQPLHYLQKYLYGAKRKGQDAQIVIGRLRPALLIVNRLQCDFIFCRTHLCRTKISTKKKKKRKKASNTQGTIQASKLFLIINDQFVDTFLVHTSLVCLHMLKLQDFQLFSSLQVGTMFYITQCRPIF